MCTIGAADSAFNTTRTELPQAHIRRTQQWARVDVSALDKHIEGTKTVTFQLMRM
jgi:hypothetical protein